MNVDSKQDHWYWEVVASCSFEIFETATFFLIDEFEALGIEEIWKSRNLVRFKVYFPGGVHDPASMVESAFRKIEKGRADLKIISTDKKEMQNWQTNWRDHFRPLEIGTTFLVRPPWERPHPEKKEIVINPGLGFGTGYHESTCLAIQLLEWLADRFPIGRVVDVGTGSGILTIAALLLKAEQVTALDIDEEAIKEVPRNLELSGFEKDSCTLLLKKPEELDMSADLVLANIESMILERMAESLIRLTAQNGYLILSGILTEHRESLLSRFQAQMHVREERRLGEWHGLVFQKNG
ncbi:MAG: methyltransferase domain-containing protein [Proteobacteria bacterium]|nr:methyltransferase domain-containing protein [Pseudomonadota bacterium]